MKLANLMIGMILGSMVIIGIATFMEGFEEKHKITIDKGWQESYDAKNLMLNITTIGGNMSNTLGNKYIDWAVGGVKMGMGVLRLIFYVPQYIHNSLNDIAIRMKLCGESPCWILLGLETIITIIIIFMIAQALVRWYL